MSTLRFRVSGLIKELVLGRYRIPFSRSGLDPSLVPFLSSRQPVALVDVGASSGSFTATVQDYCGVRRAMLVEPQPLRCRELETRFGGLGYGIHACALSDQEGTADMDILAFDYSSSLLTVKPEVAGMGNLIDVRVRERIKVPVRTLDGLLGQEGWHEPIDLLKIDVQGAELKVLQGGRDALRRTRLIWTEVSFRQCYEGSAVFQEVHDYLVSQGFGLRALQEGFRGEGHELLQADALFMPIVHASSASR